MSKAKSTADSDGSVSRVVFADSSERFPERDLRLPLFQKSFNSQGIAVFRCPYCGYESFNNQHVKNHVRYKHTGERPYPCALCSKGFVKNVDLKRHMRIHTGEKPFQCPKCKKLFRHKDSLKYHLLKVNQCQRINV
ncbi:UNVERIFIED_CONTAM: hypothetical protein GTU68_011601 [Idotea baltica]|nr:hypothetical protein [Idotea baltica]